jgi:hypothetical protein
MYVKTPMRNQNNVEELRSLTMKPYARGRPSPSSKGGQMPHHPAAVIVIRYSLVYLLGGEAHTLPCSKAAEHRGTLSLNGKRHLMLHNACIVILK